LRKIWEIFRIPTLLILTFLLSALVTVAVMGGKRRERFVPNVVGLPFEEGVAKLRSYGFKVKVSGKEPSRWIPEGHISSQDPEKGRLDIGEVVYLRLSSGKPFVKVPSLRGMRFEEALQRLQDMNLDLGSVSRAYSGWARKGIVLAQYPEADSVVREGTRIGLLVSRGIYPPSWW
jgi:serine/threonine-protein kinase